MTWTKKQIILHKESLSGQNVDYPKLNREIIKVKVKVPDYQNLNRESIKTKTQDNFKRNKESLRGPRLATTTNVRLRTSIMTRREDVKQEPQRVGHIHSDIFFPVNL